MTIFITFKLLITIQDHCLDGNYSRKLHVLVTMKLFSTSDKLCISLYAWTIYAKNNQERSSRMNCIEKILVTINGKTAIMKFKKLSKWLSIHDQPWIVEMATQ